ncbi:phage antirepressor KilAC domain-containing protein [Corynebacterium sp. P6129]|uniref:phage antirepressor KilAC domain-containing protein n=1 Tax=Corynebacterium antarcticum TaxID=2800405 RepID=UPI002260905B|nr:phage antirepressor KilAC domain-containing protein [Corynebacterium antarcticum]MCX7491506.1 phage antirepressor KilAC domain-containing protein [Corynebacterium antarcticum]
MMTHLEPVGASDTSPFDTIKHTNHDGTEYWSARELMPLMGYDKWENFLKITQRAESSARNAGQGGFSQIQEKLADGGRPRTDYTLTRFAAYLVAMNGDPNKLEVARAQAYFAVRTREAETAKPPAELTRREILTMALEAEERAELEAERANRAELEAKRHAQVIDIQAPMVAKATAHSSVEHSVGRQEFARQVQQFGFTRGVDIKQHSVYTLLARHGMTIKGDRSDRGHITAQAVRNGWGWNHRGVNDDGYEYVTPKLTKKGQDLVWKWILKDFETYGPTLNPKKAA